MLQRRYPTKKNDRMQVDIPYLYIVEYTYRYGTLIFQAQCADANAPAFSPCAEILRVQISYTPYPHLLCVECAVCSVQCAQHGHCEGKLIVI